MKEMFETNNLFICVGILFSYGTVITGLLYGAISWFFEFVDNNKEEEYEPCNYYKKDVRKKYLKSDSKKVANALVYEDSEDYKPARKLVQAIICFLKECDPKNQSVDTIRDILQEERYETPKFFKNSYHGELLYRDFAILPIEKRKDAAYKALDCISELNLLF